MKHNFQRSRPSPAIISSLKAVSEVTKKSVLLFSCKNIHLIDYIKKYSLKQFQEKYPCEIV